MIASQINKTWNIIYKSYLAVAHADYASEMAKVMGLQIEERKNYFMRTESVESGGYYRYKLM